MTDIPWSPTLVPDVPTDEDPSGGPRQGGRIGHEHLLLINGWQEAGAAVPRATRDAIRQPSLGR